MYRAASKAPLSEIGASDIEIMQYLLETYNIPNETLSRIVGHRYIRFDSEPFAHWLQARGVPCEATPHEELMARYNTA